MSYRQKYQTIGGKPGTCQNCLERKGICSDGDLAVGVQTRPTVYVQLDCCQTALDFVTR